MSACITCALTLYLNSVHTFRQFFWHNFTRAVNIQLLAMVVLYVARNVIISQIDCIVTTAGGVEEDFIKCLSPTYLGDFHLSGRDLRARGINRTGNLLLPNDNYCKFEDWVIPILDQLLIEQKEQVGGYFSVMVKVNAWSCNLH